MVSKLGHDIIIKPHDSVVKEFRTIRTNRVDKNSTGDFKDFLATSIIDAQDIKNFDYSDTMAKFKITKMMKAAGIRGARNGRDQKNPDRYKYYAVKVEPAEREVFPASIRYYEEDDRFDFYYGSIYDSLEGAEEMKGYIGKLTRAL